MSRTLKLFYTTLHLQRLEGRGSLLEIKGPSTAQLGQQGSRRNGWIWSIVRRLFHGNYSFLVPSITTIVVANVHFLISVWFPVNFSYLTAGSLSFVPPVLLSLPPSVEGGRGGK